MSSQEKWETIKELFQEALEEAPSERSAFLAARCPDVSVLREVERLLGEHEQARSFLSDPVFENLNSEPGGPECTTQALIVGTVLAGRFKIIKFIASGGMGEVYEALDEELGERVAVKTVRPQVLNQPNALSRFRREVQLSRQVTHPNVCRIFDLFRHKPERPSDPEVVFISMELLHGEHLAARLKNGGAMTPEEALPLIRQMCSALAAAHATGIVHRDLKPQNVVLVKPSESTSPRAVVTDFGLAFRSQATAETTSFSTGPGILGTPAYMAPEQIEGREATAASDIYALGLVIYEMVTGNRPFHGDTPLSAAFKRLSESPTSPRKFKPGLSPVWEETILRCLEKDPRMRFSNVDEVAQSLTEVPSIRHVRLQKYASLRISHIALLMALLLGIIVAGYAIRHRISASRMGAIVHRRPSIAVVGFKNLSQRSDEAWLSTALAYQLTTALTAGEQVRTVPGETLEQMKASFSLGEADGYGKDTLLRIRRFADADQVVVGSYLALGKETGGKLHLDLKLQDAGTGETTAAISEDGTEDGLPELVANASTLLLRKLSVQDLKPSENAQWRAVVSSNPEVNRLYAEGLSKLRMFDALAARELLQRAVIEDSSYAPAHSALATAWKQLGYEEKAASEAKLAFDLAAPMSREERLNAEARYYDITHQWQKAIEAYHALFVFFPDNIDYGLSLSAAQINGGKNRDALDVLQVLHQLPFASGTNPRIDLGESKAFEALGDLTSAKAAALRAVEASRSTGANAVEARADVQLCFVLSNLGDFTSARNSCERAEQIYATSLDRGGLAHAQTNTGNLLADQGELASSKSKYESAIANYRAINNKIDLAWALNNLGTVLLDLNDLSGARKVHEEALSLFRETQQKRGEAASYNNLANVAQILGNLQEATTGLKRALAIQRELGDKRRVGLILRNLAEVDYLLGNLKDSSEHANQAAEAARNAGSKANLGDALTTISSIEGAQAQTNSAIRTLEEAQAIFSEMGHKLKLAYCWAEFARFSLDQRKFPEAQTLAQKAINAYQIEKDSNHEARSRLVLSEILLGKGDISGAENELHQAETLLAGDSQRQTRWDLAMDSARVRAASGDLAAALHNLESIRDEAKHFGIVPSWLEARLLIGELELKAGRNGVLRDLKTLDGEARSRGFILIADKAVNLGRPAPQ